MRLHSTGISLREAAAVLEAFGVYRSHQAVFQWIHRVGEEAPDPPQARPRRVAVDETAMTIVTEQYWLYATIDVETKLLLGVRLSERRETRLLGNNVSRRWHGLPDHPRAVRSARPPQLWRAESDRELSHFEYLNPVSDR